MCLSCLAMIAHSVQVRATLYRFSGDTAALSTMGFRQHDGSLIVRGRVWWRNLGCVSLIVVQLHRFLVWEVYHVLANENVQGQKLADATKDYLELDWPEFAQINIVVHMSQSQADHDDAQNITGWE